MSFRRVGVLFMKDLRYGSKNFIFVFAVVMPLVVSLVVGLLFGTLFSEKPKLGIVDMGDSELAALLAAADFLAVQSYDSEADLTAALETGGAEVGLVLADGFDAALRSGERTEITFFVWGQSLVRNRAIISAAVADSALEISGRETPITVDIVLVGDRAEVSWQQRLLPLLVLMAVVFGGMMVPATSMIEERLKRTLSAVTTTPMSMAEVFAAKGLMGVALSIFSGFAILTLNGGWGPQPILLVLLLTISGMFAAAFGIFVGSRVKDIQTLFALMKSTGILIYAPAIVALFPEAIPQWIARLFPTYYIMQPVLDISQGGAGLGDIALDLLVLCAMTAAAIFALGRTAERLQVRAA
ncbi:MAG: ABC transporter permease [Chloroflexi bacterium]|nr:ABC transporter permease [Chloroflexota bacterium]